MQKTRLKEPQIGVHFRAPPPTLRRLDALGVAAGMTRSQVIRLAVDAAIEVGEGEKPNDQQRTG